MTSEEMQRDLYAQIGALLSLLVSLKLQRGEAIVAIARLIVERAQGCRPGKVEQAMGALRTLQLPDETWYLEFLANLIVEVVDA